MVEPKTISSQSFKKYSQIRRYTEEICKPLQTEDYVVQPVDFVSPPKWHLGHTTWFFETFILRPFYKDYREFHPDFSFVFNSYYEAAGDRVLRSDRGNLTRPTVKEVYSYRRYVDEAMEFYLQKGNLSEEEKGLMELGFQHEQQHQELLWTDIKYILGHNPLFPEYSPVSPWKELEIQEYDWIKIKEGMYSIGYTGGGFCYDNELGNHKVHLGEFTITKSLITNHEYIEFIENGGYGNFEYWHAEAWDWLNQNNVKAPLYWHKIEDTWFCYKLTGLSELNPDDPVCHISYYEAAAFAAWKGMRLPTEFEWEAAADKLDWGQRWEWTDSAYLPYPGFKKAEGAIGEYNGKFMVNQMVLRGGSTATSPGHSRKTYRNFFHPQMRWQFTGLRLAK